MTHSTNECTEHSPVMRDGLRRSKAGLLRIMKKEIFSGDAEALYPTLDGLSTAELPTKLLKGTAFERLCGIAELYPHLELSTFADLARRGFSDVDIRRLIGRAAHYGKKEVTGREILARIGPMIKELERESKPRPRESRLWQALRTIFPKGGLRLWNVWRPSES